MTHGESARKTTLALRAALALCAVFSSVPAHAFLLQGEALDTAANVIALIVIFVVPVAVIVVFWMLHVLPEKIAHKRRHPQTEAIKVLCLLSLAFGGLLWPLAWLWAFSKPVLYKAAYGTDTLEPDEPAGPEQAALPAAVAYAGQASPTDRTVHDAAVSAEISRLRADIDRILINGAVPKELAAIRDRLDEIEPQRPATKAEELH